MTATLTIFFMMQLWGSHADHVGNRRVLRLTSYFIPFVPMLWLFSHNVAYLIAIQFFAGFFWAGFNMSASNFMYDAVTPEKRTRCIAYYNVLNGIAAFAGAVTGGFLAHLLPPVFGNRLLSVFLLSGLLRLAASPLCSTIREVRQVKNVSNFELFFSVMTARPPSSLYAGR
jgi:MFS family permease